MNSGLLVFTFIVLLLIAISLKARIRQYRRAKDWDAISEAKSSPLSQAVLNLVGTAGGIYLSLVLLQTFLEVDLPGQISIGSVTLEPLATLSIALAIAQPFVIHLWSKRRFLFRKI